MRALLTSEARFERTPDRAVWAPPAYGQALWARYLDVFSTVIIAARVSAVREPSAGCVRASRANVEFCDLPPYAGLSGLVQNIATIRRSLNWAVRIAPAIIVRTPSPLAYLTCRVAAGAGRPFAAEVVGDPDQVFAPGAFRHPLRGSIRRAATAAQRRIAREALAVLYVTSERLQQRYPTRGQAFAASDAVLDDSAFNERAPLERNGAGPFVLAAVGGLDQPYKGTSILLQAVSRLRRRGVPVTLRVVGSGRLLSDFRQESEALGISADVEFLGQLDSTGVRRTLDSAHLFVLPSLTEGLPRALLEAMARGMAAVASNVGGVPELLPSQCLVPPRDPAALAASIEQLMHSDGARRSMAIRNREHARLYHERLQEPVRREFLRVVHRAVAGGHEEARCA